jgi:Ni,Fe-hydrogenase III small subunit
MVMIAKNRDHTKWGIQMGQRCFQTSGSLGCTGGVMADHKVSGQQNKIRPCSVHLANDPSQPSSVHRVVT